MPRPRTVPDRDLLDAALALVRAAGPQGLTFAALASRTGLAASTLVQRFGTKAALLRAALSRAWDRLDAETASAAAAAPPGPRGLIELLTRLSGQYGVGDAFADQLLILREDLRDPVLRARGQRWLATLAKAVGQRLDRAPGSAEGLGALIVTHWQGSVTIWSFTRHTALDVAVRDSLEGLFARLGLGVSPAASDPGPGWSAGATGRTSGPSGPGRGGGASSAEAPPAEAGARRDRPDPPPPADGASAVR
jgi:AcrR family transcriptional regulator